jgi:hypothetical protein
MLSVDVIAPFVVLAFLILLVVLWYIRQGRNTVLEEMVQRGQFGSPVAFRGTLSVEQSDPGHFLRLAKSTKSNRWLQFRYRWLGTGRRAIFDEVEFDGPRGVVRRKRGQTRTETPFSEFYAIRMREVSGGKGGGSLWYVELIPQQGAAIPFVASELGGREMSFGETAAVAKAVSAITMLPVHVFVAGNIWTPGWPPKSSATSS